MRYKIILFLIFLVTLPCNVFADEIQEVHWGTEVWKGYTDTDGSGLYTQVLKKIFDHEDIELKTSFMPFERTLLLTRKGQLDFSGGIPKDKNENPEYIQAKYPILFTRFNVFFRTESVGTWNGLESLKGKKIVCTPTIGDQVGLQENEYSVLPSRKQMIQLVIKKRYDFYLDVENIMSTVLDQNISFLADKNYRVENIVSKGWYMIAPNSERGRSIMEIYNKGIIRLYKSGELKAIYDGYSLPFPFEIR